MEEKERWKIETVDKIDESISVTKWLAMLEENYKEKE